MKKRQLVLFWVISLLLFLTGCTNVSKLPTVAWLEKVMQTIGVGPEAVAGDNSIALFMKFLIWLLVFAIVYFGVSKVLKGKETYGKDKANRSAIVVSFVISLMGVLMIPNRFIIQLYQQYSMMFALLLAAAPLIGGIAIYYEGVVKKKEGEGGLTNVTKHVIGFVLFLILASVYGGLSNYIFKFGAQSGLPNHQSFFEWAMFATSMLYLIVVGFGFQLIMDIFKGWKSDKGESSSDDSKDPKGLLEDPNPKKRDGGKFTEAVSATPSSTGKPAPNPEDVGDFADLKTELFDTLDDLMAKNLTMTGAITDFLKDKLIPLLRAFPDSISDPANLPTLKGQADALLTVCSNPDYKPALIEWEKINSIFDKINTLRKKLDVLAPKVNSAKANKGTSGSNINDLNAMLIAMIHAAHKHFIDIFHKGSLLVNVQIRLNNIYAASNSANLVVAGNELGFLVNDELPEVNAILTHIKKHIAPLNKDIRKAIGKMKKYYDKF